MLNTMIIVKLKKTNYTEWKNFFDGNAEMRTKFMRDALVGKVDENTAIVTADIFVLFAGNHSQVGIEGFSGMSLSHLINTVLHQKGFIFW